MPVLYTPPTPASLLPVPGVMLGTAAARIKAWARDDVLLVVCAPGTVAAGVFTRNRFCAAPVIVCREHLQKQHRGGAGFRALIVNAGNANAGTGEPGLADARAECAAVARMLDCAPEEVLPYSTGVIMEPLPLDRILAGLPAAHAAMRADGWFAAASAIMTTDTVPKGSSRQVVIDGVTVTVTGIAKGAGMIHPDMATMLSFMATDAPVEAALLAQIAREVADVSFNGATIDGDTSTNDSFVLAATGRAALPPLRDPADPRMAMNLVAPIRRWSRPRSLPPTPISGASCARSAMPPHRISIPRESRSGSTTSWWSTMAGVRRPIARKTASA